jgi:hypothetical protein
MHVLQPTSSPTSSATVVTESRQHEWSTNKEKWDTFINANQSEGYDMVCRKICRCIPDLKLPYRVSVKKGTVTDIKHINGAQVDNQSLIYSMITVEQAFELIQNAWVDAWEDAASVIVTYDADVGYPTCIYIDQSLQIADEEYSFSFQELILT